MQFKGCLSHNVNIIQLHHIHIMYLCISQCMPKFSNPVFNYMVFWKYISLPTRKFQVDHQFSQVNIGLWLYIALYVHTECKPCWNVLHKMCWNYLPTISVRLDHRSNICKLLRSDSKLLRSPNSSASFSQKIQSYWEPCLYHSLQWGQRPSVCSTSAGGPKWRSKFIASCHQNINDVGTQHTHARPGTSMSTTQEFWCTKMKTKQRIQ